MYAALWAYTVKDMNMLLVVVEHLAVGTFLWVLFILIRTVIRDGALPGHP